MQKIQRAPEPFFLLHKKASPGPRDFSAFPAVSPRPRSPRPAVMSDRDRQKMKNAFIHIHSPLQVTTTFIDRAGLKEEPLDQAMMWLLERFPTASTHTVTQHVSRPVLRSAAIRKSSVHASEVDKAGDLPPSTLSAWLRTAFSAYGRQQVKRQLSSCRLQSQASCGCKGRASGGCSRLRAVIGRENHCGGRQRGREHGGCERHGTAPVQEKGCWKSTNSLHAPLFPSNPFSAQTKGCSKNRNSQLGRAVARVPHTVP